jgi:hypothetical protein
MGLDDVHDAQSGVAALAAFRVADGNVGLDRLS